MKNKVYLAGPLFTKYEIVARKKEHKLFKETFKNIESFSPIDAPFNEKNPTNQEIFEADYNEMMSSNIFIFDLNNMDTGTLVELGIAIQMKENNPNIKIYSFLWDLRLNRTGGNGKYDKPWGINAFLIGGAEKYGIVCDSFEEVINCMKKDGFN